jgi:hypothetical protein
MSKAGYFTTSAIGGVQLTLQHSAHMLITDVAGPDRAKMKSAGVIA